MAVCIFFRLNFLSRDEETPEVLEPLTPRSSNPGQSLAIFQILQYSKYDLQQILKRVLEIELPLICAKDRKIPGDLIKRALKLRA